MAVRCCHAILCHPYRSSALPSSRMCRRAAAIKGRVNKRWDFRGHRLHPALVCKDSSTYWTCGTSCPRLQICHVSLPASLEFSTEVSSSTAVLLLAMWVLLVSLEDAPEYPVCSPVAGGAGSSVPCCCLAAAAVDSYSHVVWHQVDCLLAVLEEGRWGAPAHKWQWILSFEKGGKFSCVLCS